MLTCPICAKEFNNFISTPHLKSHDLTRELFCELYPNSPLKSVEYSARMAKKKNEVFANNPELRQKISEATKKAMTPKVIAKISNRVITDGTRLNMSKSAKIRANNQEWKDNLYTEERNKKVSDSKKKYWKTADKSHITNLWKEIKNRGEDKWRQTLIDNGKKGFSAINALGKNRVSKLEQKIRTMLEEENIQYIPSFQLNKKIYDIFLPQYNILIECDGTFWHKLSLDECTYKFHFDIYHNDRLKDQLAKKNGYQLFRIREDNIPESLKGFLNV